MATIYCKLFSDTGSDNRGYKNPPPLIPSLRINKRFLTNKCELSVHFPMTEMAPMMPDHFHIEVKGLQNKSIFVLFSGFIPGCAELCAKYNIGFGHEVKSEWWYSRALIASTYVRHGFSKMLNIVHGEYSVILLDRRNRERTLLYVATDRVGSMPIYSKSDSEDDLSVSFSNGHLPGSNKLEPGYWELFTFSSNSWKKVDRKKYFAIEKNWFDSLTLTPFQYMLGTLNNEIRSMIPANKKVVCMFSGGLFSTVIAVILSKYVPDLSTVFVGVNSGARGYQSAMIVSEKLRTNHTNILMDDYDFCRVTGNVICLLRTEDVHTVRDGCVHYLAASGISSHFMDDATVFLGDGGGNVFSDYTNDDLSGDNMFELGAYFRMSPRRKPAKIEDTVTHLDQIYRRKFGISIRLPYFTSKMAEFASRHDFFREDLIEWLEKQIPEPKSEYYLQRSPMTSAFPMGVLYDMTVHNFANVNESEYYSDILGESRAI